MYGPFLSKVNAGIKMSKFLLIHLPQNIPHVRKPFLEVQVFSHEWIVSSFSKLVLTYKTLYSLVIESKKVLDHLYPYLNPIHNTNFTRNVQLLVFMSII